MASQAQLDANRLNALRSTGPRSVEGKAASRFNALKSGIYAHSIIIQGENAEDFEALIRSYHEQFRPANPLEAYFVDTLARCSWTARRLRVLEAQTINALIREEDAPHQIGMAMLRDAEGANAIDKIFRHQNAQDRAFHRALKELRYLQASRPPEPPFEPEPVAEPEAAPEPPAEMPDAAPSFRPMPSAPLAAVPQPENRVRSVDFPNRPSAPPEGYRR